MSRTLISFILLISILSLPIYPALLKRVTISNFAVSPSPFSPTLTSCLIHAKLVTENLKPKDKVTWKIQIRKPNKAASLKSFTGLGPEVSASWDGKNRNGVLQSDGIYFVSLTAYLNGNKKDDGEVTVVIDGTAPILTVSSPEDGITTLEESILVSGTVSEPSSVFVNESSATVENNSFTTAVSLQIGENTITIAASDLAGNSTSVVRQVTRENPDVTPPVITILSPQDGSKTGQGKVTVTGTVDEESSVMVNGESAEVINLEFSHEITLIPGSNLIEIKAVDLAGNEASAEISIEYDNIAPEITLTNPTTETLITNQSEITIEGSINEEGSIFINNEAVVFVSPPLMGGVGEGEDQSGSSTFTHTLMLSEGENAITIKALDTVGNMTEKGLKIILDTIAPEITLTNPTTETLTTNQNQITISGSVSEELESLTLNGTAIALDGLNFSMIFTLSEGNNVLILIATDLAGNSAEGSRSVVLDSIPPSLTISEPQDGESVQGH